jgi:vancomycin permeability regulator SanA
LHWVLALSKATEPPKVEDELSKRIREGLAELKALLNIIEEARKKYLG